jgi:hypothetical protein
LLQKLEEDDKEVADGQVQVVAQGKPRPEVAPLPVNLGQYRDFFYQQFSYLGT